MNTFTRMWFLSSNLGLL